MKKYTKTVDLKSVGTCAIHCPFLSAEQRKDELNIFCEKYQQKLFVSDDGQKLIRAKDCSIVKVSWIFEFDESKEI